MRRNLNDAWYEWGVERIGKSFKRPKGQVVYKIKDVQFNSYGHLTRVEALCDTPNGERRVNVHEIKHDMEEVLT